MMVFFENVACVSCGHRLAYLPDCDTVGSLDEAGEGLWRSPTARPDHLYRLCANYTGANVCNWALAPADASSLCVSCRLTRVVPDLSVPGHLEKWYKLEVAKRRLVYTLGHLSLPLASPADDPQRGLAFDFLADEPGGTTPVLTGHDNGVITISVAEADDAERERRRTQLHEPYRTLLGHVRHEIGHHYWDRLIAGSDRLDPFRAVFGDDRRDYSQALQRHYDSGPPADWQARFVTTYASAHPWEDWAETWAHYLHVVDTIEAAAACGVSIRPRHSNEPASGKMPEAVGPAGASFDRLIASWFPLTYVLNNLNRGLGVPDGYPFVLSAPAIDKLRFVHETIASAAG
jgi:hypothetical protein